MPGAPASDTSLWDSQADLMNYDVVLLGCEGNETYDANPSALEGYLNAGGRAFASHFHYAWFSGPLLSSNSQGYKAPGDWNYLASWQRDQQGTTASAIGGSIDQTLNASSVTPEPFPKGVMMEQWLERVGALGQGGGEDLTIYQPFYNALVALGDPPRSPG